MISENTIPYIGTKILWLTKNDHNSMQKAPKSIIPEGFKSAGHFPSSCEHVNMRTCEHANMRTCEHANLRTCEHVNMRTCEHANMRTCEHANMRTCEHANLRTCEHANMRTCEHPCDTHIFLIVACRSCLLLLSVCSFSFFCFLFFDALFRGPTKNPQRSLCS